MASMSRWPVPDRETLLLQAGFALEFQIPQMRQTAPDRTGLGSCPRQGHLSFGQEMGRAQMRLGVQAAQTCPRQGHLPFRQKMGWPQMRLGVQTAQTCPRQGHLPFRQKMERSQMCLGVQTVQTSQACQTHQNKTLPDRKSEAGAKAAHHVAAAPQDDAGQSKSDLRQRAKMGSQAREMRRCRAVISHPVRASRPDRVIFYFSRYA